MSRIDKENYKNNHCDCVHKYYWILRFVFSEEKIVTFFVCFYNIIQ